jgi:hypothetical protein
LLWEVFSDTPNFFPNVSRDARLEVAERFIRELLDDGWAHLAAPDGTTLTASEAEAEVAQGRWRQFPPAPDDDVRLTPTAKWRKWSEDALA